MTIFNLKKISILGAIVLIVGGCSSLGNLRKNYYHVANKPLEVHGGKIAIDIKTTFPPRTLHKKASVNITPVLRYENGEKTLKSVCYQGKKFDGDNMVIPYRTGKSMKYTSEIDYQPEMANSALFVDVIAKRGRVEKSFRPLKIADGIITTSFLVRDDFKLMMAPIENKIKRIERKEEYEAIHFPVNSAVIPRKAHMSKRYKKLNTFIAALARNPELHISEIEIDGYASPEGEMSFNESLSNDRANAIVNVLTPILTKNGIVFDKEKLFDVKGHGADWKGFFETLEASNVKDKGMIYRSLAGKPLLKTREKTLGSLLNTYSKLNSVLQPLRRADIRFKYEKAGKDNETLKKYALSNPSALTAEELLFTAGLFQNDRDKMKIYDQASLIYANDYRVIVNKGYELNKTGKEKEALVAFEKAYRLSENPVTANNMGVVKVMQGDTEAALKLFTDVDSPESRYNQGVILIKQGEYDKAIGLMAGQYSFNLALAQLLSKKYDDALETLDSTDDDSAMIEYLRAIVYARKNKSKKAADYIAKAVAKDAALEAVAKKDLEFRKIYGSKKK